VRRFDAVIFDMDGVLIDSEPLHFGVLRQLLATLDCTLSADDYQEFIGTTTEVMFDTLIRRHGLPVSVADAMVRYDVGVLGVLGEPHPPQPGVVALIARLRELNVRVAVASSSRRVWIDATLGSIGLADAFDVIVSGDDVVRGKPEPEIYLLAAERLGVAAERCVAIEDSPHGVQSAHRAGMFVLGVRTAVTAHLPLDGAHRVVDSLADLDLSQDVFGGSCVGACWGARTSRCGGSFRR
jgi:HAD superfamily hydrolase (TIGR01509 family)